jgi:predicted DNA-binding transcriptional regulator AlpA
MLHQNPDRLLTEKELSAWIGRSVPSLQRDRSNGDGPPFVQIGPRRIAYRRSDVDTWLTARTKQRVTPALGREQDDDSSRSA